MNDSKSKVSADVELFSGCLRLFEPNKSYGDAYLVSCSLHWVNKEEVELKGMSSNSKFSVRYRQVICEELKKYGVKVLRWERKTDKGSSCIRIDTLTKKIL